MHLGVTSPKSHNENQRSQNSDFKVTCTSFLGGIFYFILFFSFLEREHAQAGWGRVEGEGREKILSGLHAQRGA